jgi:hypothetical protein
MRMRGRRRLAAVARSEDPLDLGMRVSQVDEDLTVGSIAGLTVDLAAGSVAGLTEDLDSTEDSDSVADSDAGDAVLVSVGDGVGTRGGGEAGDRHGGDGAILATRTGE